MHLKQFFPQKFLESIDVGIGKFCVATLVAISRVIVSAKAQLDMVVLSFEVLIIEIFEWIWG
jgi:hypothetical protein